MRQSETRATAITHTNCKMDRYTEQYKTGNIRHTSRQTEQTVQTDKYTENTKRQTEEQMHRMADKQMLGSYQMRVERFVE